MLSTRVRCSIGVSPRVDVSLRSDFLYTQGLRLSSEIVQDEVNLRSNEGFMGTRERVNDKGNDVYIFFSFFQ